MNIRSFRINNYAIADFIGVAILAEIFMTSLLERTKITYIRRIFYYIFFFMFGIVVHDILGIDTQITLN